MFLTKLEMIELTGVKQAAAQKKWLQAEAIPFRVGADGRVKVLKSFIEAALGGKPSQEATRRVEPKWERI